MIGVANWKWVRAFVATAVFLVMASAAMAGNVSLVGEVNENYQIVADGQIYDIADTPEGNELAENHISAKVKVVGTVEESEDMKIITVTSYEVIAE